MGRFMTMQRRLVGLKNEAVLVHAASGHSSGSPGIRYVQETVSAQFLSRIRVDCGHYYKTQEKAFMIILTSVKDCEMSLVVFAVPRCCFFSLKALNQEEIR